MAEAGCTANEIMAHQRTRDDERACPLHQSGGSGAARPQRDEPITKSRRQRRFDPGKTIGT